MTSSGDGRLKRTTCSSTPIQGGRSLPVPGSGLNSVPLREVLGSRRRPTLTASERFSPFLNVQNLSWLLEKL